MVGQPLAPPRERPRVEASSSDRPSFGGYDTRRQEAPHESLARCRRRRLDEPGARLAVRLERVRPAAREGIRLDAQPDVVGLHDRRRRLREHVRAGGPHPGPPRSAAVRAGRRHPRVARVLRGQLHDVALVSLRRVRTGRRRRQRLRLRDADAGRVEVVSRSTRPRRRTDGRRLRRRLGDHRPDRDQPDHVRRLAADLPAARRRCSS